MRIAEPPDGNYPLPAIRPWAISLLLTLVCAWTLGQLGPHAAETATDRSSAAPQRMIGATAPVLSVRRYDALIDKYSGRYGIDPALVKAVIQVESGFRASARSARGARGLMQLMPRTGRAYGARNLEDPGQNVRAGVRHLRTLLDRHGNNPTLAVAAYNAGSGAVRKYRGVPPFAETRRYVVKVMRIRTRYSRASADECDSDCGRRRS